MRELVFGMGEEGLSRAPETLLVTCALGSCVAVMVHDPVARLVRTVRMAVDTGHVWLQSPGGAQREINLRPHASVPA